MKKSDIGLLEAGAALTLHTGITSWAQAAAVAFGVALPALPLFKQNYLFFLTVLIVLLWVKLRGESWARFGLIAPTQWGRNIGYGLLLFAAHLALNIFVLPAVQNYVGALTGAGEPKVLGMLGALKGNLSLFMLLLPFMWLFAAFGEEVFYRGYLMTRFAQFMGEGRVAWTVAIVVQALLFGAAHAYQGPAGMAGIALGAMLSGVATLILGRNLWPAIIAHGLIDTLGFTLLYLGLYGQHA